MKKKDLLFNKFKIILFFLELIGIMFIKKSGFIIIEKENNNNIISIPSDNKLIRGINCKVIEK